MPKFIHRLLFRRLIFLPIAAVLGALPGIGLFILALIVGDQIRAEKFFIITGVGILLGFILGVVLVVQTWGVTSDEREERERTRKAESITCECGKLAEPIDDTDNRYSCKHCNRQFAGPPHSL
jgi:hypothetical protein